MLFFSAILNHDRDTQEIQIGISSSRQAVLVLVVLKILDVPSAKNDI